MARLRMMLVLGWTRHTEGSLEMSPKPQLSWLLTPLNSLALEYDIQARIANIGRQVQRP